MTVESITIGTNGSRQIWFNPERRSTHLHVIGGSGRGKSKFLEHMIREDILKGHGLCLIDPHGEICDEIVSWCARHRIDDFRRTHLIDPRLGNWRTGFNPLKRYENEEPLNRVDNAIEALAQVWGAEKSTDTPSIRTVLRAIFTALIENGQTLAEAFPLTSLDDEESLRQFMAAAIKNPLIRETWAGYQRMSEKAPRDFAHEFGGARRRLLELLHDDRLREMFGQNEIALDLRRCMDESHIVLVNFAGTGFDENRARVLGALLIREFFLVAKQRDLKLAQERPFYLYIDECAGFLTPDIASLLAQTRKFGLHAILSHQWLEQLKAASPEIYAAVMAIQNKVVFGGLRDEDATLIANELFRTEYDCEMPVELLIRPTVVRYQQTWLEHWAESTTEGSVESSGDSESANTAIANQTYFDEDGFPVGGVSRTEATSTSVGMQSSTSNVSMTTYAHGKSEAYLPVLEDRPTAVHSLQNVQHMATARLRALPKQHAVVKAADLPSFDMKTYKVDPVIVAPESRAAFIERVMHKSPYALPTDQARAAIEDRSNVVTLRVDEWKNQPLPPDDPEDYWSGAVKLKT